MKPKQAVDRILIEAIGCAVHDLLNTEESPTTGFLLITFPLDEEDRGFGGILSNAPDIKRATEVLYAVIERLKTEHEIAGRALN
jgi:hypothetical protein